MKKLMWIISFISLAGTAIVIQFLPESVPMHYDFEGNIDRWGSRNEELIFPFVIIALALFWYLLTRYFEKKAERTTDDKERASFVSNAKVLSVVGLSTTVMQTVIHGFSLYSAYSTATIESPSVTIDMGKITCILMGVLFIVLGNFMTKTRINGIVGVRVCWSMYNDNTWRKSNRFGAFAIMISGVLTIITAVFMKNSFGAMMITVGYLCIATIIIIIYAYKVYKEEIAKGR